MVRESAALIEQLVQAAEPGWLVVVRGPYGSGKVQLCEQAVKRMGRQPLIVELPHMEADDFNGVLTPNSGILDRIRWDQGVILDGFHQMEEQAAVAFALAMIRYIRLPSDRRVTYLTVPPDGVETPRGKSIIYHNVTEQIRQHLLPVTGESLGGSRIVVEIPK